MNIENRKSVLPCSMFATFSSTLTVLRFSLILTLLFSEQKWVFLKVDNNTWAWSKDTKSSGYTMVDLGT
jgi:hypothetical protein